MGILQSYLGDNRLAWVEAGLGSGRSPLKSKLVWVTAAMTLISLFGLAYQALEIVNPAAIDELDARLAPTAAGGMPAVGLMATVGVVGIGLAVVILVIYALPLWFTATSWKRDIQPDLRDQIALSAISPRQLLGAKTLIWIAPALVSQAVALVGGLLLSLWVALEGGDPAFQAVAPDEAEAMPWLFNLSPIAQWALTALITVLTVAISIAWWLIALGFATRGALRGWGPLLTLVLSTLLLFVVGLAVGMISAAPMIFFTLMGGGAAPEFGWGLFAVMFGIQLVLLVLVTWSVWRDLDKRVAKTFELSVA